MRIEKTYLFAKEQIKQHILLDNTIFDYLFYLMNQYDDMYCESMPWMSLSDQYTC